jgi:hypothetical protein
MLSTSATRLRTRALTRARGKPRAPEPGDFPERGPEIRQPSLQREVSGSAPASRAHFDTNEPRGAADSRILPVGLREPTCVREPKVGKNGGGAA